MASTIDIFNSKIDIDKLVGKENFFNNQEELTEFNKLQQKYLSNINYSQAANFARFGSAEEYYKNTINYINSNFPYDNSTSDKLEWINSLNELEYHIYKNEYPRSVGYVSVSGTQNIKAYSHIQEPETEAKKIYYSYSNYKANTFLNLIDGITVESWLKFDDSTQNTNIISVQALSASESGVTNINVFTLSRTSGSQPQFSITDDINTYNFSSIIVDNEWHHYAFKISSDTLSLFIDGTLTEELTGINLSSSTPSFIFVPLGLMLVPLEGIQSLPNVDRSSVFQIGGGGLMSTDEFRVWNGKRSVEKIGRYWFTNVDGNDFNDVDNSNLLFYYKFNEGWDAEYGFLCLDYSGRENDGEINDYSPSCRLTTSAINECGFVQDVEKGDIVYKGLSYSQEVKEYYSSNIQKGITHDEQNIHLLYNKFPGWILQQEEESDIKHLKQIIQIISSYFDDLYNKIGEITEYKKLKLNDNSENVYPFYDKILTSNGFNVTDLFTNLDTVEKISSRNDINLFDEDIQKVKNKIFQNIYNNLAYILKSKGTEKSINSLLKAYGINDQLVRVNLYANSRDYKLTNRSKETIVRKKTVTMLGDNSIYLSSDAVQQNSQTHNFSLEISVAFPNYISSVQTSSLFGIQNNTNTSLQWSNNQDHYYVTLENGLNGTRFCLNSGSTNVAATEYVKDFYDNSVWNVCLRKYPIIDDLNSSAGTLQYKLELYGVNKNRHFEQEMSCSAPYNQTDGFLRYYIGARKQDLTGLTIIPANSKFLYCNFWNDYLNNEVLISHNKDILNYGTDE